MKLLRKVFFYFKQFGISRTLSYVRANLHMYAYRDFKGHRWINPNCRDKDDRERIVAIIGSGRFAFSTIAYFLKKNSKNFLRYVYSPGRKKAVSLCKSFNGLCVPSDWRDILKDDKVKIVFILSPYETHAYYAIECINAGKHVYIEKPPVISEDQLEMLKQSMIKNPQCKVFLGFNRSSSENFVELKKQLTNESGSLTADCYMLVNKSKKNHTIINSDQAILEHVCHLTDLILRLVPQDKSHLYAIKDQEISASEDELELSFSVRFGDQSKVCFHYKEIQDFHEGMEEVLEIKKGNLKAYLINFQELRIVKHEKKVTRRTKFRDHGHNINIQNAYLSALGGAGSGEDIEHIESSSKLYLKIMESMREISNDNDTFHSKI